MRAVPKVHPGVRAALLALATLAACRPDPAHLTAPAPHTAARATDDPLPPALAWYIADPTYPASANFGGGPFGFVTDVPVPADYDGDGRADVAVWRPDNGVWYVQGSHSGFATLAFGQAGDVPVPADYDGDGRTDPATYRVSEGVWYVLGSLVGPTTTRFGEPGDVPVPGTYLGRDTATAAVWRAGTGAYYVRNADGTARREQFAAGDSAAPGDYDGDGLTDAATWRPSDGVWSIVRSTDGVRHTLQLGEPEDTPVPADYDADGITDAAVFRPSSGTWYVSGSQTGVTTARFGQLDDVPLPRAFAGREGAHTAGAQFAVVRGAVPLLPAVAVLRIGDTLTAHLERRRVPCGLSDPSCDSPATVLWMPSNPTVVSIEPDLPARPESTPPTAVDRYLRWLFKASAPGTSIVRAWTKGGTLVGHMTIVVIP